LFDMQAEYIPLSMEEESCSDSCSEGEPEVTSRLPWEESWMDPSILYSPESPQQVPTTAVTRAPLDYMKEMTASEIEAVWAKIDAWGEDLTGPDMWASDSD